MIEKKSYFYNVEMRARNMYFEEKIFDCENPVILSRFT